jgi:hypothetical protein
MGRPRKYEDDAARKRAQRERMSGQPDTPITTDKPIEAPPEQAPTRPVASTGQTSVKQALAEAEEAYVQTQLAQTREYASSFRAPEKKSKEALAARMKRAEAYARWRFRTYLDSEVASL